MLSAESHQHRLLSFVPLLLSGLCRLASFGCSLRRPGLAVDPHGTFLLGIGLKFRVFLWRQHLTMQPLSCTVLRIINLDLNDFLLIRILYNLKILCRFCAQLLLSDFQIWNLRLCNAPSSLVSSLGHVNIRSWILLRSLKIFSDAQPILSEIRIVFKFDHFVILYGIQALLNIGFLLGLYL